MLGRVLVVFGTYSLVWAVLIAALAGPYLLLALVIGSIPYGTVGLLGLAAGLMWRRGSRLGRPLATGWVLVGGAWTAYELAQDWLPRIAALGDPGVWYNWAQPDMWIPVPLAAGVVAVAAGLLAGHRPVARSAS